MQVDDAVAYPRLGVVWCGAVLVEHVVVEIPAAVAVFLPPLAYAAHIVGRGGAYRVVGVAPCVAECRSGVFGHALYLERQYFELLHHSRHAGRNHTEVFGASEHIGRIYQRGQLPHCLVVPERIVAVVEEVVVEAVEAPAFIVVERAVYICVLCRDSRVVLAFFNGVFDEEHIVDKAEQAVAYAGMLFVLWQGGEVVGHFALGVEFGLELVAAVACAVAVGVERLAGVRPEEILHEVVHYVRSGLEVDIDPEVVVIAKFAL